MNPVSHASPGSSTPLPHVEGTVARNREGERDGIPLKTDESEKRSGARENIDTATTITPMVTRSAERVTRRNNIGQFWETVPQLYLYKKTAVVHHSHSMVAGGLLVRS